ncbi:hypothetical protein ACVGX7_10330, partial [Enterobacter hormaechei]
MNMSGGLGDLYKTQTLMSVGYFNGGGDDTAGPGGDINKLDVRQITHLNYS